MFSREDAEELSSTKKFNKYPDDSMLGKVFGYFGVNKEDNYV